MVRARRVLSGAAAVATLLTACGSPPAPVTLVLVGTVTDAAGTPLEDVTVRGRRSLDARDIDTTRHSELDSLGLACADERRPPACNHGHSVVSTDAAGGFALSFRADDIGPGPSVVGGPEPIDVVAQRPRGPGELTGAATSRGLASGSGDVQIDPLVLWEPALDLSSGPEGDGELRWTGPTPGPVVTYRVLVEDSGGRLVWNDSVEGTSLTLRRSDLEGTRGAVSVAAVAAEGSEVWRSPRVPYRADDGAVRLALPDEVGWPFERGLSPTVVLVGIVSLLLATAMLVIAGGVVNRRQLTRILPPLGHGAGWADH